MEFIKILKKDFKKFSVLSNLNNLVDVPDAMYVVGNLDLLNLPTVTVIGSRKISNYGTQVISDFIPQIVQHNICIVSGLAYGCDFEAQKVAVESGGVTIGVLGCGFNYVKSHQYYTFITNTVEKNLGLFVTEFEPEMPAAKWTFIKRDRIMASLGDKILVIEASLKSGTMHTVNFALELGKEVYAVPGNIYNSNSIGTNMLIQSGANMFLGVNDLLYPSYAGLPRKAGSKQLRGSYTRANSFASGIDDSVLQRQDINGVNKVSITVEQKHIIDLLDNEKSVLQISKSSGFDVGFVLSQLTLLELAGVVKKVADKWVKQQN